jgi:hypothetical protein
MINDHSKMIVKSGSLCWSQLSQRSRYMGDGEKPFCAAVSSETRRAIRVISLRSRVLMYLIILAASRKEGRLCKNKGNHYGALHLERPPWSSRERTSCGNTSPCHLRYVDGISS